MNVDFDSQKLPVDDQNKMLVKADAKEELSMRLEEQEEEDEESSEKYLVDDETWLVIAKQRLVNRSSDNQPIGSVASTSKSPIQARINRRKTSKINTTPTLDPPWPLLIDTNIGSSDFRDFQDWIHLEITRTIPSDFEVNMEDRLLDLKGRAMQLAELAWTEHIDLEEMKAHPEVDVPSTSLDLISPTSSDRGLVDEILLRSLSSTSSCQDVSQTSLNSTNANKFDEYLHQSEGSDKVDCEEEDEDDPEETIVPITDKVLERNNSQDSLEPVESLQDDDIHQDQEKDCSNDINLSEVIKNSCRRSSKSLDSSAEEGKSQPSQVPISPRSAFSEAEHDLKRITRAARIDKSVPRFLDLSIDRAKFAHLRNVGLFTWHMPFRHVLFHQLSDKAEATNDPQMFAPTGNFYAYLERRKIIPNEYQGPTWRQVNFQRTFTPQPQQHRS